MVGVQREMPPYSRVCRSDGSDKKEACALHACTVEGLFKMGSTCVKETYFVAAYDDLLNFIYFCFCTYHISGLIIYIYVRVCVCLSVCVCVCIYLRYFHVFSERDP